MHIQCPSPPSSPHVLSWVLGLVLLLKQALLSVFREWQWLQFIPVFFLLLVPDYFNFLLAIVSFIYPDVSQSFIQLNPLAIVPKLCLSSLYLFL